MKFIKHYQFNYIKKLMKSFDDAFISCVDIDMIRVTQALIEEKIYSMFSDITEDQRSILSIQHIDSKILIQKYLVDLEKHVCGMQPVTSSQIKKLFKKEKKLKMPNLEKVDFSSISYLSWRDLQSNKIYVVHYVDGCLRGMICRALTNEIKGSQSCAICGRSAGTDKVGFVSVVNTKSKVYKSLGFSICLDHTVCNSKITSVDKLEELIDRTSK